LSWIPQLKAANSVYLLETDQKFGRDLKRGAGGVIGGFSWSVKYLICRLRFFWLSIRPGRRPPRRSLLRVGASVTSAAIIG
jgi:hypothetical protein